jgi:hypothetical protein
MAEVTGLSADRMLAIEAASIVSGTVNGSGHLILTKHDGSTIDAGYVVGPAGSGGTSGDLDGGHPNSTYTAGTDVNGGTP